MILTRTAGPYTVQTEIIAIDGGERSAASDQAVELPDGGEIIVAFQYADGANLSLYDDNHNLFRLDKDGKVVWQVRRDERGWILWPRLMTPENLKKYPNDCRIPFQSLGLLDGKSGKPLWPLRGGGPGVWKPGMKLIAGMSAHHHMGAEYCYEVDVETGLAVNISTREIVGARCDPTEERIREAAAFDWEAWRKANPDI